MSKIKITVATIGHMPGDFKPEKIREWKSSLFEIQDRIESYSLNADSDGTEWDYSDQALEDVLPQTFDGDFLIAIINVPIELNWFTRRLTSNRVVFTFHEIKECLRASNIPLENAVYRVLYAYAFLYKRSGNRIPNASEFTNFTHDDTRGCLFDMNGLKVDIIYSCHNPIICPDCVERLRKEKVSNEAISDSQKEIKKIRKILFYRIADYIKLHPLWSLAISSIVAVILGAAGSILGSYIYAAMT